MQRLTEGGANLRFTIIPVLHLLLRKKFYSPAVCGRVTESFRLSSTNGCQVMSENSLQFLPVVRCWWKKLPQKFLVENLFPSSFYANLKISPNDDFGSGFMISSHGPGFWWLLIQKWRKRLYFLRCIFWKHICEVLCRPNIKSGNTCF